MFFIFFTPVNAGSIINDSVTDVCGGKASLSSENKLETGEHAKSPADFLQWIVIQI